MHQISYPDCKGGGLETKSGKLDTKAELMAFFTLCRQSLHLGIMARVVHSKLVCQELLLDGLYSYQPQYLNVLNPNHYLGLSQAYLPQEFYDAGYGETEALGDATETWISQFENYEINNINFSSYNIRTTQSERHLFGFIPMVVFSTAVTLTLEKYLIRTSLNNAKC